MVFKDVLSNGLPAKLDEMAKAVKGTGALAWCAVRSLFMRLKPWCSPELSSFCALCMCRKLLVAAELLIQTTHWWARLNPEVEG